MANPQTILEIRGLITRFATRDGVVTAVDGVSLTLSPGECLGVVGESGSGKSVTFASVMGLIRQPGWIDGGSILFQGRELVGLAEPAYRALRGKDIAMTMQDALTALNPALTMGVQIMEVILAHADDLPAGRRRRRRAAREQAIDMMRLVGIPSAETRLDEYPHQFSGGQRQRIGIARALALKPGFIVCDEPVSALDVSIQAQIIELLDDLKRELGLTYLFISHDISVIGYVSDRLAVMYLGEIVETGPVRSVLEAPRHPYTQALLSAVPRIDAGAKAERVRLTGDLPSPIDPPPGCKFHARCPLAMDVCRREKPAHKMLTGGVRAACHLLE